MILLRSSPRSPEKGGETNGAGASAAGSTGESQTKSRAETAAAVTQLLRGEEPPAGNGEGKGGESQSGHGEEGGGDSQAGRGESQPKKGKPKTLDDIAERLGVEASDLWGVTFKMGGEGEEITLGKLKDSMSDRSQHEADRLTWEEGRSKKEREFLKAQQEINEIIGALPKESLKPELLELVSKRIQARADREAELTKHHISAWTNEETATKEREQMDAFLSEYGFPKGSLESVLDHRMLVLLRDAWQRKVRVDRALERLSEAQAKQHGTGGGKPSKSGGGGSEQRSGAPGKAKLEAQVNQVSSILREALK